MHPTEDQLAQSLSLRRLQLAELGQILQRRMDISEATHDALKRPSTLLTAGNHAAKLFNVRGRRAACHVKPGGPLRCPDWLPFCERRRS